ncbi:MAG: helix-turn-helix transcriptional regulator [Colwellia sp.]|nr:helix-turn-helix transcriptional regulator [Colwellia sp.]
MPFFSASKNQPIAADETQDYHVYQLAAEMGKSTKDSRSSISRMITLATGFSFIYTKAIFEQARVIKTKQTTTEPILVLTFAIQGDSLFIAESNKKTIHFIEGSTSITHFSQCQGERHYQAGSQVAQIRLSISKNWLSRHLGQAITEQIFSNNNGITLIKQQPTTPTAINLCLQLTQLSLNNALDKLTLHALAVNLLKSELSLLIKQSKDKNPLVCDQDQQQAKAIKQLIDSKFSHTLTIKTIANTLGSNESKIKKLCQQFYGESPFQLLTRVRMQHALALLTNDNLAIAQVADKVSYRHSSNFSLAFKDFYGLTPGQVVKAAKNT